MAPSSSQPAHGPARQATGPPARQSAADRGSRPTGGGPAQQTTGGPAQRPTGGPAPQVTGGPPQRPADDPAPQMTGGPAQRPADDPAQRPTGGGPPAVQPIGQHLASVAKVASRAFDDALAQAGGTLPVWLVLISIKSRRLASQRELADVMGIEGATLTHHLNGMESAGLVTRRRDPANRRIHVVELTPEGDALFLRLRDAAMAFDARLRAGLSEQDLGKLGDLLDRLRANVA